MNITNFYRISTYKNMYVCIKVMNPFPDPNTIDEILNTEIRNDIQNIFQQNNRLSYSTILLRIEACLESYREYKETDSFNKVMIWTYYAYNMLITRPTIERDNCLADLYSIINELRLIREDDSSENTNDNEDENENDSEDSEDSYVEGPLNRLEYKVFKYFVDLYKRVQGLT